jgi:hypothetical protein
LSQLKLGATYAGTSAQTQHSLCDGTEEVGKSARFPVTSRLASFSVTDDLLKRS